MPIYVHRNNQQLGPYSAAEVRTQVANGGLSVHDHVWWHGQTEWIPLGESPIISKDWKEPPGPTRERPPKEPRLSALAVGALAANVGCAVGSFAAIVMGHMALAAMKEEPTLKGRGMAIAGLIIGYILALIYVGIFVIYVVYMPQFLQQEEEDQLRQQSAAPSLTTNALPHPSAPASASAPAPSPAVPITNQAPVSIPPVPATIPATTNSPDQSTTNAPASTNSPTSSPPGTNAPAAATNAAPMN